MHTTSNENTADNAAKIPESWPAMFRRHQRELDGILKRGKGRREHYTAFGAVAVPGSVIAEYAATLFRQRREIGERLQFGPEEALVDLLRMYDGDQVRAMAALGFPVAPGCPAIPGYARQFDRAAEIVASERYMAQAAGAETEGK